MDDREKVEGELESGQCIYGGRRWRVNSVHMEEEGQGGAREWTVYTRGMFLHLSIVLPTITFPISEGTLPWSDHWQ